MKNNITKNEYKELISSHLCKHIMLNLTNKCNCACTYCFTHPNSKRLELSTAKRIIHWLLFEQKAFQNGIEFDKPPKVNFFGGEPMLEYSTIIKPIIEYCKENEYNIDWGITTNCTLLTEEVIDFFNQNKVRILASIDGGQYTQDDQRPLLNGGSSWEKIRDILPLLAENNITFRSTITPRNVDRLLENYSTVAEYGFRNYFAILDFQNSKWNEEDFDKLKFQLIAIATIMYNRITEGQYCPIYTPFVNGIKNVFDEEYEFSYTRCGLGVNGIGVGPDGYFYGCQEFSTFCDKTHNFYIGNIWDGFDEDKHMALLNQYNIEDMNEKCKDCDCRYTCFNHGCLALCYNMTSNLNKACDSWCKYQQLMREISLIIINRLIIDRNEKFKDFIIDYIKRE